MSHPGCDGCRFEFPVLRAKLPSKHLLVQKKLKHQTKRCEIKTPEPRQKEFYAKIVNCF